ncbi:MAG: hypothetical protein E7426_03220 [Ruminococcaceae bacterium]|nr:hypothetical protein [Oscillospiraceae bacterium]
MTNVISVRFRNGTKTYYFDPRGLQVAAGDDVVVETAQGLEFAQCTEGNHDVADGQVIQPLRPLVRIASENDRNTDAYNRTREKEAFDICQKKIAAHKLEMKLVRVECSFDGSKILFFFTADGRVDFRELVKDLAGVFRSRIELRQIGVRDEAKMLGGLGICGRPFCCAQFMDDFLPVSIKMAKTQSLSLNPTKISGTCGRLMCCLKYEQDAYEDALKRLPKNDSFVLTPDGPGNVSDVNVLREKVTVKLDDRNDAPRCYHNCEVCVLRNGKGGREGIHIPDTLPERYVEEREDDLFPGFYGDFTARPLSSDISAAAEEGSEKRRRRGRRGGKKTSGEARPEVKVEVHPAAWAEPRAADEPKGEGGEKRRHRGRGGRKVASKEGSTPKPSAPKVAPVSASADGTVPRKRTHRGGRRHRSSRPKTEG